MGFQEKVQQLIFEQEKVTVFNKGDVLLRTGDIENNLYFIKDGTVKLCYLNEEEEQIIRLGYNGSIINSLASFLSQQPSDFYIEAVRKTEVIVILKSELDHLISENTDNLKEYTKFLEELLVQQVQREIDVLITSPALRLERVLERSPNLFQYVPLKYIASYLRMSPETLSRIRKS